MTPHVEGTFFKKNVTNLIIRVSAVEVFTLMKKKNTVKNYYTILLPVYKLSRLVVFFFVYA